MARGTKRAVIDRFQALIDKSQEYTDRLMDLVNAGKVKSGALLVHSWHQSYHYNWLYGDGKGKPSRLYGWGKEEARLWDYSYHYAEFSKELDRLEDLVLFVEGGGDYQDWMDKTYGKKEEVEA